MFSNYSQSSKMKRVTVTTESTNYHNIVKELRLVSDNRPTELEGIWRCIPAQFSALSQPVSRIYSWEACWLETVVWSAGNQTNTPSSIWGHLATLWDGRQANVLLGWNRMGTEGVHHSLYTSPGDKHKDNSLQTTIVDLIQLAVLFSPWFFHHLIDMFVCYYGGYGGRAALAELVQQLGITVSSSEVLWENEESLNHWNMVT